MRSAELILATLVESQIGAAMPMPQDMAMQPPPADMIGHQHQQAPAQQQQQQWHGHEAHQGNGRIVRFNHQGALRRLQLVMIGGSPKQKRRPLSCLIGGTLSARGDHFHFH